MWQRPRIRDFCRLRENWSTSPVSCKCNKKQKNCSHCPFAAYFYMRTSAKPCESLETAILERVFSVLFLIQVFPSPVFFIDLLRFRAIPRVMETLTDWSQTGRFIPVGGGGGGRAHRWNKNCRHFIIRAPDLRPSSLALSVADSTALMVAARTPPCSRV